MQTESKSKTTEFKALQSLNHPNLFFMMSADKTLMGFYWRLEGASKLDALEREKITQKERSKYFNNAGRLKVFRDVNATYQGVA